MAAATNVAATSVSSNDDHNRDESPVLASSSAAASSAIDTAESVNASETDRSTIIDTGLTAASGASSVKSTSSSTMPTKVRAAIEDAVSKLPNDAHRIEFLLQRVVDLELDAMSGSSSGSAKEKNARVSYVSHPRDIA